MSDKLIFVQCPIWTNCQYCYTKMVWLGARGIYQALSNRKCTWKR